MLRLHCPVMNYAWGKLGPDSAVASLKAAGDPGAFLPDPAQPYAELWMGTHAKGMAGLVGSEQTLARHLAENKGQVGDKLAAVLQEKFRTEEGLGLPFLLKVLSVAKALSIQVHPNKAEAAKLHASDPSNYRDANHKPEMAIALTHFELLCGFRRPGEILQQLRDTPELFELVGGENFQRLEKVVNEALPTQSQEAKDALQACFSALMRQPALLVEKNVRSLTERLAFTLQKSETAEEKMSEPYLLAELIIRLNYSFPGDVGCLAPFFLNHFSLSPGEAVYLGPNEPHAYLYGDCVECMANSDNVIRAGLTPKFKDVETLLGSLTYRMAGPEENKFKPVVHPNHPHVTVYDPPIPEFVVHKLQEVDGRLDIPPLPVCSLLLFTQGQGHMGSEAVLTGQTFLVPADKAFQVGASSSPLVAYRAFTDLKDLDGL